jgi:hypothetical protein
MSRLERSPDIRARPKKKRSPSPKNRPSTKILRFVLTIVLAIVLAVVFMKMIMPGKDVNTPQPKAVKTITPQKTAEGRIESSNGNDVNIPDGAGEETERIYRGEGGEPVDDPKITWEITVEISGQTLRLLTGSVAVREFAGDLPTSDFSFSVAPNRYVMKLTESGTASVLLDGPYDPLIATPFSINDRNQFFIYLTPKKLSVPSGAVPSRFLTERENSPLITMQGVIRADNKVVGTFHSIFTPDIEYVLEPVTAE